MMRRLIFSRVLVIGLLLTVVFGGGAYVAHKYWNQIMPSNATTTTVAAIPCSSANTTVSWVPGSGSAGTAYAWITAQYKGTGHCTMTADWALTFTGADVDPSLIATESSSQQWSNPPEGNGSSSVLEAGPGVTVKSQQVIWKEFAFYTTAACPSVDTVTIAWPDGSTNNVQPTYLTAPCSASFPVTVSPTYVS